MSHTLRQYSTAAKCCKILSSRHDMAIVLKKKKKSHQVCLPAVSQPKIKQTKFSIDGFAILFHC